MHSFILPLQREFHLISDMARDTEEIRRREARTVILAAEAEINARIASRLAFLVLHSVSARNPVLSAQATYLLSACPDRDSPAPLVWRLAVVQLPRFLGVCIPECARSRQRRSS